MALVQCPECHQEVSDKALSCPHCGAPRQPAAAEAAAPAPPTAPVPDAAPAPPRRSPLVPALLVLVVAVGAFVVLSRQGGRSSGSESLASPPGPAPRWIIDNVDATEECTQLGEYCVRVRCAITNAGTAAGIVHVAADLREDSTVIATRRGTRSVEPAQQDTLTLDFPEANMGPSHGFRCYATE